MSQSFTLSILNQNSLRAPDEVHNSADKWHWTSWSSIYLYCRSSSSSPIWLSCHHHRRRKGTHRPFYPFIRIRWHRLILSSRFLSRCRIVSMRWLLWTLSRRLVWTLKASWRIYGGSSMKCSFEAGFEVVSVHLWVFETHWQSRCQLAASPRILGTFYNRSVCDAVHVITRSVPTPYDAISIEDRWRCRADLYYFVVTNHPAKPCLPSIHPKDNTGIFRLHLRILGRLGPSYFQRIASRCWEACHHHKSTNTFEVIWPSWRSKYCFRVGSHYWPGICRILDYFLCSPTLRTFQLLSSPTWCLSWRAYLVHPRRMTARLPFTCFKQRTSSRSRRHWWKLYKSWTRRCSMDMSSPSLLSWPQFSKKAFRIPQWIGTRRLTRLVRHLVPLQKRRSPTI